MNANRDRRTGPWRFRRGLVCFIAILLLLISSYPVRAHDPPTEYYARNITVELHPGFVRVVYRLEISQVSLFNLPQVDKEIKIVGVKDRNSLALACLERFKVLIPDKLLGELNGKPLTWKIEKTPRIDHLGSVHFLIWLRADWLFQPGINRFEIVDTNFLDKPDPFRLKFDLGDGVELVEIHEPRESPRKIDDVASQTGWVKITTPEALAVLHLEWALRLITGQSSSPLELPAATVEASPPPNEPTPETPSIWELLRRNDLAALLGTSYGFWLLLLIALVHGAGHSLMPGHGKTMVAAYLVGERGTPWHAVLLGIVTTLTHTSAAIAVAIAIRYTTAKAETVNTLLLFIGGLAMAGIGVWLFLQRMAGRSDHVHLFDMGHAHSHGDTVPTTRNVGTLRLILLGMAGGIIPCWGAIVWVIGCIATSQFWLALPIVLAFSVGLSSVLILVGLSVVYSGRIGNSRWGERDWFKRLVRWLPVFGATVVIAIGIFMCSTSGIAGK